MADKDKQSKEQQKKEDQQQEKQTANLSEEDIKRASSPEETGVQRGYVNPDVGSLAVYVGDTKYLATTTYELPLAYFDYKDAHGVKLFRKGERG